MKPNCIILYGNTCSSKSTTGKLLEQGLDNTQYLSFGDLKRVEIKSDSVLSKRLVERISLGLPILPKDGLDVLKKHILQDTRLIVVSGYPISIQEYELFTEAFSVELIVHFIISTEMAKKRFFSRVVCTVCGYPGMAGDKCPVHNIFLEKRNDQSDNEFLMRQDLYQKRISPFLSILRENFPRKKFLDLHVNDRLPSFYYKAVLNHFKKQVYEKT